MEDNLKDQESKKMTSEEKLSEQEVTSEENTDQKGSGENKNASENDTSAKGSEEEANAFAEGELPTQEEAMKALAELQLKLRETQRELEEQKSLAMRLQADFINFRKRKEKEMSDTVRFANEDLLKELLPILDNFDRALEAIDKTDNLAAVKEGIGLVSNNMRRQLGKIGLEPIESKGKEFDVNLHDAITSVPVEEEEKKGIVIDEIEKGYRLKDKVIRFSKVVVGE